MDFDRIAVVLDVWHATFNTQFSAIHKAAEEELFEHNNRKPVDNLNADEESAPKKILIDPTHPEVQIDLPLARR
jgi:hypothetical protein